MKPIINHTYKIPWRAGTKFAYQKFNEIVDVTEYADIILPQIGVMVELLQKPSGARHAIINVNSRAINRFNSCLISIQFQLIEEDGIKKLYVTANYRSQCEKLGRPNDEKMILSITDDVQRLLGRIRNVDITVNVANYHINPYYYQVIDELSKDLENEEIYLKTLSQTK